MKITSSNHKYVWTLDQRLQTPMPRGWAGHLSNYQGAGVSSGQRERVGSVVPTGHAEGAATQLQAGRWACVTDVLLFPKKRPGLKDLYVLSRLL